ncbi:C40 family peptidase [Polaribacter sp.]|nr:C40 family peptidase [Polaribacter sp.]
MYGICNLSIVPLRATASDIAEMTNQLLFGEHFTIIEKNQNWSKIKLAFDGFEGFIDNKQYETITEDFYHKINEEQEVYTKEIVDVISNTNNEILTIPIGASLPFLNGNKFSINKVEYLFEGESISGEKGKNAIKQFAFSFLNTPFLWGGKSPFGIDCSGFTQLIYKLCGYQLLRNASEQATQGEVLSFIEESEPGDLAFFDNEEGEIVHVGIILNDYHIIHAHGKVRIDTLDHSGIFNADLQKHTHKLRMIKKLV